MTIPADKNAFGGFCFYSFQPVVSDKIPYPSLLFGGVYVVKVKRAEVLGEPADSAFTSFGEF
jgi:hypothetical protein